MWMVLIQYNRRIAVLLLIVVPGMVVGSVLLQYHYAVDTISGVLIGLWAPFAAFYCDRQIRWLLAPSPSLTTSILMAANEGKDSTSKNSVISMQSRQKF
eukprot:CAMPEP_0175165744 /NCGR_PEP_ID=MMETSP0087-20121206/27272_1 /TAXON_ID=136419 /ORGANISM="Unknown Unknown, Strain D1" /LENGTH=98 /DNA_ID=CAMNT_0016455187 /DNA_START=998 /DNA_END=1294 /DNA_ORIENTATION=+